jgi:thymidylate synthase
MSLLSQAHAFHPDMNYLSLVDDIIDNGVDKVDRTGVGTRSVFGRLRRFDITNGKIPLLTTKEVNYKAIVHELVWMMRGDTNVEYLVANGVNIWNDWVDQRTAVYEPLSDVALFKRLCKKGLGQEVVAELKIGLQPEIFHTLFGNDPTQETVTTALHGLKAERHEDIVIISGIHEVIAHVADRHGVSTRRLIAGDVPNIYGKQWRNIIGTRVVSAQDWLPDQHGNFSFMAERYRELGYQSRGQLPDGEVVIERSHDQLNRLVELLKTSPDSRRILMDSWTVDDIDSMGLPLCHPLFQCWTRELSLNERLELYYKQHPDLSGGVFDHEDLDGENVPRRALSSMIYFRSNDIPLGHPFNIVQYSLLTHVLAKLTNMTTEHFVWVGGDVHIYHDQDEGIRKQLARESMPDTARVEISSDLVNFDTVEAGHFKLKGYQSHPPIKFPPAAV